MDPGCHLPSHLCYCRAALLAAVGGGWSPARGEGAGSTVPGCCWCQPVQSCRTFCPAEPVREVFPELLLTLNHLLSYLPGGNYSLFSPAEEH